MTDNTDGTYSYEYTPTEEGTATVSISVLTSGGVLANFWRNVYRTGEPDASLFQGPINNLWEDEITPVN